MKQKVKLVTKEDLTQQQLRDLDYQYQNQFLDEKYFYDGYVFRTNDGEISKNHPSKIPNRFMVFTAF